jgi:predicted nucleic acid-binding protein
LASVAIAYAEIRAVLAAAHRDRRLTALRLAEAKRALETVWAGTSTLLVDDDLIHDAGDLAERHRLRGYDALHLAGLVRLGGSGGVDLFACWDADLRRAAEGLGYQLFPV